jgi:DNA anti-recombination protein RmuC
MPIPCDQTKTIDRIEEKLDEVRDDISEIKGDLREHMSRTLANEKRIELIEDITTKALDNSQKNLEAILRANKDNQNALNKQLKIALGVFAGLAALVSALAAWISH